MKNVGGSYRDPQNLVCAAVAIAGATLAAPLLVNAGPAAAQTFPSVPITIVVGYTAGGVADALARVVAKRLGDVLKVPLVVENKPGANGIIAAKFVAGSKPDGHTLLLVTDAMTTIDPQLPGSAKYDVSAELDPLINLASAPRFGCPGCEAVNSDRYVVELWSYSLCSQVGEPPHGWR